MFLFLSVQNSGRDGKNNAQGMMGPPGQPGTPGEIGPKGAKNIVMVTKVVTSIGKYDEINITTKAASFELNKS